ncbi:MAG TPA: LysE family translocator [Candidatus Limnocylindrales bacterium]|nr:LysE family translocator [Candidatus Limnocylindrales bacterium]
MPIDSRVAAFLLVAVLVAITPGPDMLLVMRNSVARGRRIGAATVVGIVAGILGWGVLAAFGVAAILAASSVAFAILKLAGAAYLVFLGVMSIKGSRESVARPRFGGAPLGARSAVIQGALSAGLNPKLGVFFLTLLPQFVSPGGGTAETLAFAIAFAAIGLAWLLLFTALVGSARTVLERATLRRGIERVSGVVLVGLGVRVAVES